MDCASFIAKLPYDLQEYVHDHVLQLRKPRHVLTDALKCDIETYRLLDRIEFNYTQVFPKQHASCWMENALVRLLNDHRGPTLPFHNRIRDLFPNATDEGIRIRLSEGRHMHRLWIAAPPQIRRQLHDISCDMLVHRIG
jgi:hypothetical protein